MQACVTYIIRNKHTFPLHFSFLPPSLNLARLLKSSLALPPHVPSLLMCLPSSCALSPSHCFSYIVPSSSILTLALVPFAHSLYPTSHPFDVPPGFAPLNPLIPQPVMPFAPEHRVLSCFWDSAPPAPVILCLPDPFLPYPYGSLAMS